MKVWLTIDEQGGRRTGPFGAWWAWLTPRQSNRIGISSEVAGRARIYNVAALACLVAFAALTYWQGATAPVLASGGVLTAGTGAGLALIHRRPAVDYIAQCDAADVEVATVLLGRYGPDGLRQNFPDHATLLGLAAPTEPLADLEVEGVAAA